MSKASQGGFSILEMIVVMLIAFILGHLVILKMAEFRENFLLERQRSSIISKLEEMAVRATQDQTSYVLNFEATSFTVATSSNTISTITLAPGFAFGAVPKQVTFYAGGTGSPETIELQGLGKTCRISISLRGRISPCL